MARQNHPNDSHESGQVTDWRLVYTLTIAFVSTTSAFYSVIAPIYWAFDSNSPLAALLLIQDGLTSAMSLALCYIAVCFTLHYPLFGLLSCMGTVLCAASLVRGG